MAKALNEYFIDSVAEFAQSFPNTSESPITVDCTLPSLNISYIFKAKLQTIIKSLKISKAKAIYGMDTAMLKSLNYSLAPPITQIINLSVLHGAFPNVWKTVIMSPVFKLGDTQDMYSQAHKHLAIIVQSGLNT